MSGSTTAFAPLPSKHRLPLVASVPFVNCFWKSDFFSMEFHNSRSLWILFFVELRRRIAGKSLSHNACEFLDRLAHIVDGLAVYVEENEDLKNNIGLGTDRPSDGYPYGRTMARFFYNFMCAIVLDRCLWALGLGSRTEAIQWTHPDFHAPPSVHLSSQTDLDTLLHQFMVSFGSRGATVPVDGLGTPSGFNAHLCVRSATLKGDADTHRTMSNLYVLASAFWALSMVCTIVVTGMSWS